VVSNALTNRCISREGTVRQFKFYTLLTLGRVSLVHYVQFNELKILRQTGYLLF